MIYIIFQHWWEPVLIHRILIGLEAILEKCYLPCDTGEPGGLSITSKNKFIIQILQGGRAVHYSIPQNFIITLFYSFAEQLLGLLLNLDWFVHKIECPNGSTGNFVHHQWRCTPTYRPLSYPFRYLQILSCTQHHIK